MKLNEMAAIIKQCETEKETMDGPDCKKCHLSDDINLKLDIGESSGDGILSGLTLKVNPCLLLEAMANTIKIRRLPGNTENKRKGKDV